jgi:hypothetical protein
MTIADPTALENEVGKRLSLHEIYRRLADWLSDKIEAKIENRGDASPTRSAVQRVPVGCERARFKGPNRLGEESGGRTIAN